MWHTDPFLCEDGEINNKKIAFARQQEAKTEAIMEAVFPVARSAPIATQRRGKHASATVELQQ
jgi:hypothetical protein